MKGEAVFVLAASGIQSRLLGSAPEPCSLGVFIWISCSMENVCAVEYVVCLKELPGFWTNGSLAKN